MLFFILLAMYSASAYYVHTLPRCINISNTNTNGRVAVVLSGTSRSLSFTFPSIERHVFNVLTKHNLEYDLIWSTVQHPNGVWVANSSGSVDGEFHSDEFDARMVRPCAYSLVSQQPVMQQQFDKLCKKRDFRCHDGLIDSRPLKEPLFTQMKVYLCCFYTQHRAAELLVQHSTYNKYEYDAILFLRPDTAVIRDIDLPANMALIKNSSYANSIWIPDFQHWSGLNDRGAYGPPASMLKYLTRGDDFMNDNSTDLNIAELQLKNYLNKFNKTVYKSNIRTMRVRSTQLYGGVMMGIVVHFDVRPKHMNIEADDVDMKRCLIEKPVIISDYELRALDAENC